MNFIRSEIFFESEEYFQGYKKGIRTALKEVGYDDVKIEQIIANLTTARNEELEVENEQEQAQANRFTL